MIEEQPDDDLWKWIVEITNLVADRNIDQLVQRKLMGRVDPTDLIRVLDEYEVTFTHLPPEADRAGCYALHDENDRWEVEQPLWSQEEGRSDLILQLAAVRKDGALNVQISDLVVM